MDFTTLFNNEVHHYIHAMTSQGVVHDFAYMALMAFTVFELFTQLAVFALEKPAPVEHISSVIYILVAMALTFHFLPAVDALWQAGDGIGRAFLSVATGSGDPLYLAKWFDHSMALVSPMDVGIRDSFALIMMTALLDVVLFVLTTMMYLVGVWAVWGLALAKLFALLFVPCLAWKPVRPFFVKWVEYLMGFVFLMILLRVSGALAALAMQSAFEGLGAQCQVSGGHLCDLTQAMNIRGTGATLSLMTSGVLSIVLVGSSFKFAKEFSSATHGLSRGAQQGINKASTHIHQHIQQLGGKNG